MVFSEANAILIFPLWKAEARWKFWHKGLTFVSVRDRMENKFNITELDISTIAQIHRDDIFQWLWIIIRRRMITSITNNKTVTKKVRWKLVKWKSPLDDCFKLNFNFLEATAVGVELDSSWIKKVETTIPYVLSMPHATCNEAEARDSFWIEKWKHWSPMHLIWPMKHVRKQTPGQSLRVSN